MTAPCARLPEVLAEHPSADALAHAEACPTCRAERPVRPSLADAARAELKRSPRVRPWWWDVAALLGVDLVLGALALALVGLTQGASANRAVAVGLVAVVVLGAWAAVSPRAFGLRYAVAGLSVAVALGVGLGGSGVPNAGPFLQGAGCALVEGMLTVVPLALLLFVTSRFVFSPWRAIAGGLSVGATGLLVLHLHCGDGSASHLFAFHLAPWLFMASAAVLLRLSSPPRSFAN